MSSCPAYDGTSQEQLSAQLRGRVALGRGELQSLLVMGSVGAETSMTSAVAAWAEPSNTCSTCALSAESSALPHSTRGPSASWNETESSVGADIALTRARRSAGSAAIHAERGLQNFSLSCGMASVGKSRGHCGRLAHLHALVVDKREPARQIGQRSHRLARLERHDEPVGPTLLDVRLAHPGDVLQLARDVAS